MVPPELSEALEFLKKTYDLRRHEEDRKTHELKVQWAGQVLDFLCSEKPHVKNSAVPFSLDLIRDILLAENELSNQEYVEYKKRGGRTVTYEDHFTYDPPKTRVIARTWHDLYRKYHGDEDVLGVILNQDFVFEVLYRGEQNTLEEHLAPSSLHEEEGDEHAKKGEPEKALESYQRIAKESCRRIFKIIAVRSDRIMRKVIVTKGSRA